MLKHLDQIYNLDTDASIRVHGLVLDEHLIGDIYFRMASMSVGHIAIASRCRRSVHGFHLQVGFDFRKAAWQTRLNGKVPGLSDAVLTRVHLIEIECDADVEKAVEEEEHNDADECEIVVDADALRPVVERHTCAFALELS